MWRVHRDDCPGLGSTCRQLQGLYTHRTNGHQDGHLLSMEPTVTHMQAVPSHGRAAPSQRLRTADHSLDPHGSLHDSRSRPVACPRLHTCAPRRRMVRQRISNELKSKELGGALLLPCTDSHSGLLCTQACPSTSTRHDDSQRA